MPLFLSDNSPIHPYRFAWEINEFLTEDTIQIGDGSDVVTILAQAVQPRGPGNWMSPGTLGSLGVGAVTDSSSGKLVAFGLGGILVEVLKDITFALVS